MGDFEHMSLLSFILRFLTFAFYLYGVLVLEKSTQQYALKRDQFFKYLIIFRADSKLSAI